MSGPPDGARKFWALSAFQRQLSGGPSGGRVGSTRPSAAFRIALESLGAERLPPTAFRRSTGSQGRLDLAMSGSSPEAASQQRVLQPAVPWGEECRSKARSGRLHASRSTTCANCSMRAVDRWRSANSMTTSQWRWRALRSSRPGQDRVKAEGCAVSCESTYHCLPQHKYQSVQTWPDMLNRLARCWSHGAR